MQAHIFGIYLINKFLGKKSLLRQIINVNDDHRIPIIDAYIYIYGNKNTIALLNHSMNDKCRGAQMQKSNISFLQKESFADFNFVLYVINRWCTYNILHQSIP